MKTVLKGTVQYYLGEINEANLLNNLIGKQIVIEYLNKISCVACGRDIKKSYQQGYCYPCTQRLAQCDLCILSPDRCHFAKGTCREPKWGEEHCMVPHYIYLSNTSGIKVGLTRHSQIPTRWIDQGAVQAIKLLELSTRHKAGLIEKIIAKNFADKTNWRKMLNKDIELLDLKTVANEILEGYENAVKEIDSEAKLLADEHVTNIQYPYNEQPDKTVSLKLDNNPKIESKLLGIKGQYLILEPGMMNVRSHSGYHVSIKYA